EVDGPRCRASSSRWWAVVGGHPAGRPLEYGANGTLRHLPGRGWATENDGGRGAAEGAHWGGRGAGLTRRRANAPAHMLTAHMLTAHMLTAHMLTAHMLTAHMLTAHMLTAHVLTEGGPG